MGRLRRKWTAEEHVLLANAVSKALEDGRPLIWHEIAACVPGRTNKDCRKRWYGKTASKVIKGPWTAPEDERLFNAVKKHGTKWSAVAPEVSTRTGDQCSKRWSYTINPDIDRSPWTPKEDQLLLDGVIKYGRNWQQIKSIYFPRRTSLGAKNRYHLLRRRSNGARPYSKSPFTQVLDTMSNTVHRLDESLETDPSDSFSSRDVIDQDMLKPYDNISAEISAPEDPAPMPELNDWFNVQPGSRAVDADMSNSLSDLRSDPAPENQSYGDLADPGDSAMQCPPFSSVDVLSYPNAVPSARVTHQPFRQTGGMVPLPPTPPSAFRETVHSTTHDMDDFMDFSPGARPAFSWEDQALYDGGMLFPSGPAALGLDASLVNRDLSTESSAAVVPFSSDVAAAITPVATPIHLQSAAAPSTLSSPSYSSRAAYSSASDRLMLSHDRRGGGDNNTQRITIEAVCFKDDLGTIVQAVTELSLSTVFKTYD